MFTSFQSIERQAFAEFARLTYDQIFEGFQNLFKTKTLQLPTLINVDAEYFHGLSDEEKLIEAASTLASPSYVPGEEEDPKERAQHLFHISRMLALQKQLPDLLANAPSPDDETYQTYLKLSYLHLLMLIAGTEIEFSWKQITWWVPQVADGLLGDIPHRFTLGNKPDNKAAARLIQSIPAAYRGEFEYVAKKFRLLAEQDNAKADRVRTLIDALLTINPATLNLEQALEFITQYYQIEEFFEFIKSHDDETLKRKTEELIAKKAEVDRKLRIGPIITLADEFLAPYQAPDAAGKEIHFDIDNYNLIQKLINEFPEDTANDSALQIKLSQIDSIKKRHDKIGEEYEAEQTFIEKIKTFERCYSFTDDQKQAPQKIKHTDLHITSADIDVYERIKKNARGVYHPEALRRLNMTMLKIDRIYKDKSEVLAAGVERYATYIKDESKSNQYIIGLYCEDFKKKTAKKEAFDFNKYDSKDMDKSKVLGAKTAVTNKLKECLTAPKLATDGQYVRKVDECYQYLKNDSVREALSINRDAEDNWFLNILYKALNYFTGNKSSGFWQPKSKQEIGDAAEKIGIYLATTPGPTASGS